MMRLKRKNNIHSILFSSITFLLFLFSSCQEDVFSDDDANNSNNNNTIDAYLSFSINNPSESLIKSNPNGGEHGDGIETGLTNENEINNITVLFYKGDVINNALNTPVVSALYLNSDDILPGNQSTVQKVSLEKTTYHLICIINAGDLSLLLKGKTVKQVSDYIVHNAWINSSGTLSDFVMSSANDVAVDLTIPTTPISPASVSINVERIAARIDVIPNKGNLNTNEYSVMEGGNIVATNTISKVKLINCYTPGSYLIKRVANTISDTPVYLGEETPISGIQTNYVIDPWSSVKTKDNLSGNHFDITYGGSGTFPATAMYANYFNDQYSLNSSNDIKDPISGKDFYILGYTFENTMDKDVQLNGYTTGVMFETIYIPRKITNYNAANKENEVKDNLSAITFFSTNNGNSIYNSLEGIAYTSVATTPAQEFFSRTFTTDNTWLQLKEYASVLADNDKFGFKAYINDLLQNKVLTSKLTIPVSWTSFMQSQYGYSRTGEVITMNINGLDTKNLLTQKGIKTYQDGVCYYPYWIRHSNNNTTDSGIMEFAIVRNNVYKLHVASFSGLGNPQPYDPSDDPTDPSEASFVKIVVSVKPWRLIEHPVIIL